MQSHAVLADPLQEIVRRAIQMRLEIEHTNLAVAEDS